MVFGVLYSLMFCFISFYSVLYRQLRQPLTSNERTNIDFVILTSLQVLCGLLHTRIDSVDPQLQKSDPSLFEE